MQYGLSDQELENWQKLRKDLAPNARPTTYTYLDTNFGVFQFDYVTGLSREFIYAWEYYASNRVAKTKVQGINKPGSFFEIQMDINDYYPYPRCKIVRINEFNFQLWWDTNALLRPLKGDVTPDYRTVGILSTLSDEKVLEALCFMSIDFHTKEPVRDIKIHKIDYM